MSEPLPPSAEIIGRALEVDGAYTGARLGVLERIPGNPVGVSVRREGQAWAFACRVLPVVSFNRVVGLTDAALVPDLIAWFAEWGDRPRFEIAPGEDAEAVERALAAAGFAQLGEFHATLYGRPTPAPPRASGVTVEDVDHGNLETFLDAHVAGWQVPGGEQFKANVRPWIDQPGWRLFIGRYDGRPAGAATLFIQDGVGYCADSAVDPALRGHGVHQALLRRRIEVSLQAGCDLVCAQARYLSTSHRNMVRAGLQLLHSRTAWTRL